MKYTVITLLAFVLSFASTFAQEISSDITNVTVYRKGALITRTAKVNLQKGNNNIVLGHLSTGLDPTSVRIGVDNDAVTIVSVNHKFDVEENAKIKALMGKNDKRKAQLIDSIALLNADLSVLENEKALILSNKEIKGEQGITSTQLAQMAKYFTSELSSIERAKLSISKKLGVCESELNALIQEANVNTQKLTEKTSKVLANLKSDSEIRGAKVTLTYLVYDAEWTPFYEVRVKNVNSPLQLVYSARVSQKSEEDWRNVKLTLSTGDPSVDNTKPEFERMTLPGRGRTIKKRTWTRPSANVAFGHVVDNEGTPIAGCSVFELNGEAAPNGTVSDFNGAFRLEMKDWRNKIKLSFVGYEDQVLSPAESMLVTLEESQAELEEVVVVGYGSRAKSSVTAESRVSLRGASASKSAVVNNLPLNVEESLSATEFAIDMPYSVPSDGKQYDANMLTYAIDADYHYIATPRYTKETYLLANIPDVYQYSLEPGTARLFYDNVYQGDCLISPKASQDTLLISVGTDKAIAVERKPVKSNTRRALLGQTVTVTKSFEITVRNNKPYAVNAEIEDQYPISVASDIKVSLVESSGAAVEPRNGKVTWNLHLEPKESKTVTLTYEVKYPKDRHSLSIE